MYLEVQAFLIEQLLEYWLWHFLTHIQIEVLIKYLHPELKKL